ncbi:MAG: biosynthetic-type acetolactate synthase large subunit [Bacteroidales bacterium]|nr:biosynthetic-type acetolactate synthase large subunit [Bacteroidales bacterium]MBQ9529949.1 biosynthetic-type acetolactate synthase large subunit [Bacteroidales bacterium]
MQKAKHISGADALIESILAEGIETVFGYPGGSIIPIYDRLYDYRDRLNHVLVRHEQGAVHAAEGYARASGKVGVCLATSGPGATNFVTGIADAMMDSTPIVCITAQVDADKLGTNFFQEADMLGITTPITKWNYQITKASEIAVVVPQAFHIARSDRPGPVLISLTKNAQTEMCDYIYDKEYALSQMVQVVRPDESAKISKRIEKAIELLNNAEKPLIIAGQGVIISGAENILAKCANKACIPVACTLLGRSAMNFHDHYYIGMVGMHGNIPANKMTQEADVILAVGMRFSDRVTGRVSKYAPKAKIIHIDIDKTEFNKNVTVDVKIHGDAKEVLERIYPNLVFKDRENWRRYGYDQYAFEREKVIIPKLNSVSLNMAQVVNAINDHYIERVSERKNTEFGENVVLVTDVGQNQMFAARYLKLTRKSGWITSGGLGTMGFGLPAAIGAKCGKPDAQVVLICGDGGFQMTMEELGTILQAGIDIKIVLLNNSFLGMVRQWQDLFYDKRFSQTRLVNPDFELICKAYKIKYRCCSSPADIENAVEEMAASKGPFMLDAYVDAESNVFPMIPGGKSLDDIRIK